MVSFYLVFWWCRLETKVGCATWSRFGQRTEEQRLQTGQMDCSVYFSWFGYDQIWVSFKLKYRIALIFSNIKMMFVSFV